MKKQMNWFARNLRILSILSVLSASAAVADPGAMSIDEIHVKGMEQYKGKVLQVFYVSAMQSATGLGSIRVRAVKKGPIEIPIESNELIIPRMTIQRTGFDVVNYILGYVTAPGATVFVQNLDGSYAADVRNTEADPKIFADSDPSADRIATFNLLKLGRLKEVQPNRKFIEVKLSSDLD